jgi:L-histidine Nalpha-methyltransferase
MIEARVGAGGLGGSHAVADPEKLEASFREVLAGLRRPDKRIPSKYHYDERGSELFEQITRLEEYYPTRAERALLVEWMPKWVGELLPATLVELGAGSAEKSRVVLDAMVEQGTGAAYVPVDVSADFLNETARQLRDDYPALAIVPEVADITEMIALRAELPVPRWWAFLGSTLGNFEPDESVKLLRRIARRLGAPDRFLLGVDLRPGRHKSVERIELAYDDEAGVTAAFSLNVLDVLNADFGTDFVPEGFRHRSFYNVGEGRIETYLDSVREQVVRFPDGEEVFFAKGEAVRTEISSKYDRATVHDLFARAGLAVDRWVEDDLGYYALALGVLTA